SFNQNLMFFNRENYRYFTKKLSSLKEYCDILAYCLMPSHFHVLVYIDEQMEGKEDNGDSRMKMLARKIGTVQSSYKQAINIQEGRKRSLFQPRAKAKELDNSDQAFTCFNYVHQNPLKAGLVSRMEDWEFNSFNEYCGHNEGICNRVATRRLLGIPDDGG